MSDSNAGPSSLSVKRQFAQANDRHKYNVRRAEILRASGQVLHHHGVSKTTIGLIAKHAKVDRATMYYYFEDKYAIYRELILDGLTEYFDGIDTVAASTSPPGVWITRSIGMSSGVSLIAAMMVWAPSRSMCRETAKPKMLRFSWRWIMVMTRDPCDFSIARIACARRTAYQRPVNRGCSTMMMKNTQNSDERSNAMR